MTKKTNTVVQTITYEFKNIDAMEKILHEDIVHFLQEPKEGISQIAARAFLRANFAYIEAMIFCLKGMALRLSVFDKGNFTPAEKAILAESTYELDEKGRATTQNKYFPLLKNIRFAFEASGRALGLKYKLDVGNARWDSFQKAIVIRNRVTHPKSLDDLFISQEDFGHVEDGLAWFIDNFDSFRSEFWQLVDSILELKEKRKIASKS